MKMNRVQFQAGLSMAEFLEQFGTEERCEAALETSRWPDGWCCPHCGDQRHSVFFRNDRKYWQCHRCREQTSLISGTIFQATKLALTRWFLAMHLMTQSKNNVSALELKRHLGVCYKTAWLVKHKLLEVMFLREKSRTLDGRVEVDDAYLGGERPGKRGRGSENKVPFIAAIQTNASGHPQYICLAPMAFTKEAISDWANKSLAASAQVLSDGLGCFKGFEGNVASHQAVVVGNGATSVQHPQFRWVNTILGNLKIALSGTYHAFDFAKYAHRYFAEFQYRFNRRFDLKVILKRLLRVATLTRPHPAQVIRLAEDCH